MWLKRFWRDLGRRIPERLWVLVQLVRLLWSPSYSAAQVAVRSTATGGAVPRESELVTYLHMRALYYGHAEHMYRRFEAEDLLAYGLAQKRLTAPARTRGCALEVAYFAFRGHGD